MRTVACFLPHWTQPALIFVLLFLLLIPFFLILALLTIHCLCRESFLRLITLSNIHTHTVRLFWVMDRPVAETSTWQYTLKKTDINIPGRIRIRNSSNPPVADPISFLHILHPLRTSDHSFLTLTTFNIRKCKLHLYPSDVIPDTGVAHAKVLQKIIIPQKKTCEWRYTHYSIINGLPLNPWLLSPTTGSKPTFINTATVLLLYS